MKTTLIIETDDYANLDKILDSFRMIEGVKKVECMEESFPTMAHEELEVEIRKPMQQMTMNEYYAMIDEALTDAREGRTILQEDLEKEIATWGK